MFTCGCNRSAASEVKDSINTETTCEVKACEQITEEKPIDATSHPENHTVTTSHKFLATFNFFAIIVLFYLVIRRTTANRIEDTVLGAQRFKEAISEIRYELPYNLPNQITNMQKEIDRLKGEVEELNSLVAKLERSGAVSIERKEELPKVTSETVQTASYKVVYAKNFRAGVMTVCDQREAQFKLSLTNEETATFEFCGDLESAKLNFDGTFDGVCNTEGSAIDSTRVTSVVLGQVTKCDEGWKVITKSTVRFE